MPTLRDLLADGRVHVFDGAMGTMLYGRGVFLNVCYDELVLRQPDLVRDIHREYVRAGAELLETNTFGANPLKLAQYGLADETERINQAAADAGAGGGGRPRRRWSARSARSASGSSPSARPPWPRRARRSAARSTGLLAGGVDGFILETFSDVEELRAAFEAIRARSDLAVVASMTVGTDGKTHYGTEPATFGPQLAAMGADVIGINCSVGPHGVLEAIEQLVRVTTVPLCAMPNAGLPREVEDRKIYMASPEYMAEYARRLVEAGARFVGGCCGTTPGPHQGHGRLRPERLAPPRARARRRRRPRSPALEPVPLAERSRLGAKLAAGQFVTTVEIVPPKGVDPAPMFEQVRQLKAAGVDAVNVPDGPRAQSRMGALLSGLAIQREVGLEAVVHYACRDRNLLGMLSDLLGRRRQRAAQPADRHRRPAEDGALPRCHGGLRHRQHRADQPGGAAQPRPRPRRQRARRADLVRDRCRGQPRGAGPRARAQAVRLEGGGRGRIRDHPAGLRPRSARPVPQAGRDSSGYPIIAGIWPLVSLRNAEFLANEVPGITVPEAILERMRAASGRGKEAGLAEGVRIASEMLAAMRVRLQGAQVSAPLGRVPVALEVLNAAGGIAAQ